MSRRCALFMCSIALVTACAGRAPTYPHVWELRGAVIYADDTTFRVRDKSGQKIDVRIDSDTSFVKSRQPASWRSLSRGTRVLVEVDTVERGVYRARLVRIGGGGTS